MNDNVNNGGEDNQVDAEASQEIRCLIDNNQVGGIIGKGGANVKRVREETEAFVSIMKADFVNVTERIMVLKGTVPQIAKATHAIAQLLLESAQSREQKAEFDGGEQTSMRYLVHRSFVGAIIGKAGVVIKETQTQTGARIQVSNDPLPQSTEKSVTITGTPGAIHEAALRILSQLRDNPLRPGTKVYPYVPGQPLFQQPAYGGGYGQQPMQQMPYGQPHMQGGMGGQPHYMAQPQAQSLASTQKIAIPTVCAGCVIGKGGSVIRDLRTQSGTNISIADPEPTSPNERVVTLTGTPQGIQTAVYLIRQLVEQYQPQGPSSY